MISMASEAAFSADGKTLWAISREEDALLVLQPGGEVKAPRPLKLPESISQDGGPLQLQTDPQGLLIAGATKLWRWNPAEPKAAPQPLASLPPQFQVSGIVHAAGKGLNGHLLISGYHAFSEEKPKPADFDETHSLYDLAPGKKAFEAVFVRRVERVTACPVFSEGRMIFGADHDVWEGGIQIEGDDLPPTLWGHRIAPVAMCNTDGANSGSMGVSNLTLAGGTIWAALRGHLMGAAVTFPLPKKAADADAEAPDLAESWKIQRESLAQLKALTVRGAEGEAPSEIQDSIDALCSTTDAKGNWKIAFRTDHRTFWVLAKGVKAAVQIGTETAKEGE
jgi:hypothetical protein